MRMHVCVVCVCVGGWVCYAVWKSASRGARRGVAMGGCGLWRCVREFVCVCDV